VLWIQYGGTGKLRWHTNSLVYHLWQNEAQIRLKGDLRMNIWNIAVYLFLGLLGMGVMFLAVVILPFGFVWLSEKRLESEIEQELG